MTKPQRKIAYILNCKRGYFKLASDGTILYDSDRNYHSESGDWKILGFATRHNSNHIISLEDATKGVDIGQGWVHDLDHGTHRMWRMPTYRRAKSIRRAV